MSLDQQGDQQKNDHLSAIVDFLKEVNNGDVIGVYDVARVYDLLQQETLPLMNSTVLSADQRRQLYFISAQLGELFHHLYGRYQNYQYGTDRASIFVDNEPLGDNFFKLIANNNLQKLKTMRDLMHGLDGNYKRWNSEFLDLAWMLLYVKLLLRDVVPAFLEKYDTTSYLRVKRDQLLEILNDQKLGGKALTVETLKNFLHHFLNVSTLEAKSIVKQKPLARRLFED